MGVLLAVDDQSDNGLVENSTSGAHKNRSTKSIGVCRLGQQQHPLAYAELSKVLDICGHAFLSVTPSESSVTEEKDERVFVEIAVQKLSRSDYGFRSDIDTTGPRVEGAEWEDAQLFWVGSTSAPVTPNMMAINFVLFKTLSESKPIFVRQMFSCTAGIEEVLWKCAGFEDRERDTLQANAYFFLELPASDDPNRGKSKVLQIEQFELKPNATVYVFVDQLILVTVFSETGRERQTLRDHFKLKIVMISKAVCQLIKGESVVGESIRGMSYLWHWKDPFAFDFPDSSLPDDAPDLAFDILADPGVDLTYKDWRNMFHRRLCSGNNGLYIDTRRRWFPVSSSELFPPPPPPTSGRPEYCLLYTAADTLNGDVLLRIFDCYRLDDEENWNLQLRWCKLSHVCRKWRQLILESLLRLNLHIPLTKGSRTLDMLAHLPPLPLVIHYLCGDTSEDNGGILRAIQQRDRMLRIILQAPSLILHELILPMDEPFPRLETLSLQSMTEPERHTNLMLAETFLAPNLRHLVLRCICLPTRVPLHASVLSLVTLDLTDIQAPGYLHPECLAIHIRHLHQLEELSVSFTIPVPRPRDEGELLRAPITNVTLPSLKQLIFRGVAAYLESLIARITAPHLEKFSATIFNQLAFALPHLSRFINARQGLGYRTSSVIFDHATVSIAIRHPLHHNVGVFDLHISSKQFDWQVDSAGQVCCALLPALSFAEELTLYFYGATLPSKWQGEVEIRVWRDLLLPYNSVKTLWIDTTLSLEFSSVLQPCPDCERHEPFVALLPEMKELKTELNIEQAKPAFSPFINACRLSGRPVDLSSSAVLRLDGKILLPKIQSEQILRRIFTLADLQYNFEAPESDPSPDNEQLPNLGDQVIGLMTTDLIRDLYPHLAVGPSSKVRDCVRRKFLPTEMYILYGLHQQLHIPERQTSLRRFQSVQAIVFKAYIGGLYMDQGLLVVSRWYSSLIRCHVEAAYQTVRKEYLLPPTSTSADPQPGHRLSQAPAVTIQVE